MGHIPHMFLITTIISFCLLTTTLPQSHSQPQPPNNFTVCSNPFNCGQVVSKIYYPFWDGDHRPEYCGGGPQFKLSCHPDQEHASIQIASQQNLGVLDIDNKNYTMKLRMFLEDHYFCSSIQRLNDTVNAFNHSHYLRYRDPEGMRNITIFNFCPIGASLGGNTDKCVGDDVYDYYSIAFNDDVNDALYHEFEQLRQCEHITVPELQGTRLRPKGGLDALQEALSKGFEANYSVPYAQECMTCLESGGACGTNDTFKFTCHCPDGWSDASNCIPKHTTSHSTWEKKLIIIGLTGAIITGLLIVSCFICKLSRWQENFRLATKSNQDIEAFLKNHGGLTLKRYKFSDLKKMTNSFKVKLGQGGFGSVYEGMLLDGSNVAVKMLNPSKGNGEDFINEVASISRTSHVNVVTLLGFCIEGRKKALIYEFMSNGSLDKFIYNKGQENAPSSTLSWDNLYQIAIGIARGLEYLHRGCNTRILHFDIKPHNILLDENFCPKISDFGLAKLCPRKESIISMSDARGTIGYVAPEVWNRHFGGVSHKSDVYSYGMMLLEIVGGTKNINAEASQTSEIYFPDWIYKRLENGIDLGLDGEVVAIEENEVIKRMTMVGLWCIQTFPNDRPTMTRVVDMLEGNINSLEMPPKPILSSPIRSVAESSSIL